MTTTDVIRPAPFPAHDPNPLLRIWNDAHQSDVYGWFDRDVAMTEAEHDERRDLRFAARCTRQEVVCQYAFSVPTDEALDAIATVGPVVEIGAGTGYWAALLRARGVDVLAYDLAPPGDPKNHWYANARPFAPVLHGDHRDAARHPYRALMLSWPPYGSSFAYRALRAYEEAGGRHLVYIGEGPSGCCADDQFFARLGQETWFDEAAQSSPWVETQTVNLPQWSGINDYLTIYERA